MDAEKVAKGLGWFSLGLGTLEAVAPDRVGGYLGMEDKKGLLRFYGAREIGSGAGILAQDRPAPWIWSRVAGDMLDIGTLITGLSANNPKRDRVKAALGMVAAITALDIICAQRLSAQSS